MHMTGPRHIVFPYRYHPPSSLHRHRFRNRLSQPPGLTLRLEQAEDVVLTDYAKSVSYSAPQLSAECTWALDVADNAAGCVVHELDANLGNTTAGACVLLILPIFSTKPSSLRPLFGFKNSLRTGTAENYGDNVSILKFCISKCSHIPRVTLTSFTGTLAVSIITDCAH